MDKLFIIVSRKNKAGEVTVIKNKKNGFRTINLTGKVGIPSIISTNSKFLQRALESIGLNFLGHFPFLVKYKQIVTFSLPQKVTPFMPLTYDLSFCIDNAVNIPSKEIIPTVLTKMDMIGEQLLDKIDKEIERAYEASR